ncbi:phenylalanine 4-monooxygenase, partial [Streptomyces anulatus]
MFTEAQLYSPVTRERDGDVTVHLSDDHPGVHDEHYRARRNAIAALALDYSPGAPAPHIDYTDDEQ